MQFCSLHHCVLFFLILTFTTAPVSALEVCPSRAKLHHPATLSCTHQCSGLLEWNLLNKRGVVLAWCDKTSCWSEKGFSISHDQYLKGDLSLTITEADYSKRNVYACECGDIDYARVRLVIETVFTPVQVNFDEDLKLNVSVPEPVEVIYKSSDSADEVICSVTKDSLQCKDDYRDRTSLTYPELTLKHMKPRDSGSYTIRDTENNEDIQIYAVSVEDQPGFPTWGIVLIVFLLFCCVGLGIYLLYKHHMRKQLNRRINQVDKIVQQAEGWLEIREAEISLIQLEKQYIKTVYSDEVRLFSIEKRKRLVERQMLQVKQSEQQNEEGTEEKIREVEKSLFLLELQYTNTKYSDEVTVFSIEKQKKLVERQMLQVKQLLQQDKEGTEEKIREVEMSLTRLEQKYENTEYFTKIKSFCSEQREQLLNRRKNQVKQIVQQAEEGSRRISEAERSLTQLEDQYNYTVYSDKVKLFCIEERKRLIQLLHGDRPHLHTASSRVLVVNM